MPTVAFAKAIEKPFWALALRTVRGVAEDAPTATTPRAPSSASPVTQAVKLRFAITCLVPPCVGVISISPFGRAREMAGSCSLMSYHSHRSGRRQVKTSIVSAQTAFTARCGTGDRVLRSVTLKAPLYDHGYVRLRWGRRRCPQRLSSGCCAGSEGGSACRQRRRVVPRLLSTSRRPAVTPSSGPPGPGSGCVAAYTPSHAQVPDSESGARSASTAQDCRESAPSARKWRRSCNQQYGT